MKKANKISVELLDVNVITRELQRLVKEAEAAGKGRRRN